jgi:hypothetical protein
MTLQALTTQIFTGRLTAADHKGHVAIPFAVPAGTRRLAARFRYTPERAEGALFDHLISLTVFGPVGPRGCRHNNDEMDFALTEHTATPGYTPGAIEAGAWSVVMDCFRVLGPVEWRLEVDCDPAHPPVPAPPPAHVAPQGGPGWYRGDLHAHTLHSDSRWDLPGLVGFARANGLDFVTLTDHNTVSGLAAFERLSDAGLLTMGGVELTTHFGHALALGTRRWQEWRAGSHPGVSMAGIVARVEAEGAVFVIAHPRAPGDPDCTGCRWEHADTMPGPARVIEIWNGPWSDHNEEALALFRRWLDEGHRLAASAGSDTHGPGPRAERNGFNTVHAEALTEAAILAGVRAGRNVLSSGPRLMLELATADGRRAGVGGTLPAPASTAHVHFAAPQPVELRLVGQGWRWASGALQAEGTLTVPVAGARAWLMAELRAPDGTLLAVSNPIWHG